MKHSVQASASSRKQILVEGQYQCFAAKIKLDGIRKHFSDKISQRRARQYDTFAGQKKSFIELENEKTNTYKVLTSWHYLEKISR
mgnify:CR=1 FL=1